MTKHESRKQRSNWPAMQRSHVVFHVSTKITQPCRDSKEYHRPIPL
ncbi:hypothetical protein [Porphyromonas pogonae]|nr:hypothetical protein [Porphyromonas pogonae]